MVKEKNNKYIYAFDQKIKKRVLHVVKNGYAISLITGNKFKYKKKKWGGNNNDYCKKP